MNTQSQQDKSAETNCDLLAQEKHRKHQEIQQQAGTIKELVALITESREAVAFLSDKVPYDEKVTPSAHTTSSLCLAIDTALSKLGYPLPDGRTK